MKAIPAISRGVAWATALTLTLLGLYAITLGAVPVIINRSLFVALSAALVFLAYAERDAVPKPGAASGDTPGAVPEDSSARPASLALNLTLWLGIMATVAYVILNYTRLSTRVSYVDDVMFLDLLVGIFVILFVLEATRRVAGWSLTLVVLAFMAYAFLGKYLPLPFGHRGVGLEEFIDLQVLSADGIYGVPTGAVTNFVFYFVLFSAYFEITGGGKLFIDLALALVGRFRGGAAKGAVVASSLMGTISGSSVANVVGTGSFTIPLMIRSGYRPHFAGAVEAAASTGGQIMPPIMGAVAFVMAEMAGIPYSDIVMAAAIPAVLYYLGVFVMVDLRAKQLGLKGEAFSGRDLLDSLYERVHMLLPLVLLIYMIFTGYSLAMAATGSAAGAVLIGLLRPSTRLSPRKIIDGLVRTGRSLPSVLLPCASAGIIVGVVAATGLGTKISNLLVTTSGESMILALILTMIGCIIMGMGLPSVTAYIMVAIFMAPAMIKMGIPTMAAHLFILYFACLSHVTPPVAVASYAAAGIAGSNAVQTGNTAFFLTSAGFIVPFAFVANPALVLIGTPLEIVWVTITGAIGVFALGATIIGMVFTDSRWWERALTAVAAVLLITPETITDVVGMAVLAVPLVTQWQRVRAGRPELEPAPAGQSD